MPDVATTTIHALPRRALQTLDSHSYAFAKARFRVRYRSRSKQRPALVYTPGKVGSSSVASALAQALAPRGVAHLHFLTPDALGRDEQHFRNRARAYRGAPKARRFLPYYVWLGEQVRRAVDEAPSGTVWDVVTMVRDPVQRNVSAFFQNLESAEDVWVAEELRHRHADDIADELVGRFLEAYVHADEHPSTDANPLTWFEDELKPVFGIDVFATPFPTSRGYDSYQSASARLLLIRLEDLSTVAERAFSDFFATAVGMEQPQNTAETKAYGDVYSRFKRRLALPTDYLDRLYSSRYARHFYTEPERESFRLRWAR
jgi:hypothetical protein